MTTLRYLVTFAYIPDEANWCTCTSYAALCEKVKIVWDVDRPAFVYYIPTNTGKVCAVKICFEVDFALWFRGGHPITGKLIVHDMDRSMHVVHSSGFCPLSRRPLIEPTMMTELKARYCLRHSAHEEVILIAEDETPSWGRAVQKSRAWGVHRPLFRYIDDVQGERVTVSIVTAEDFALWNQHRRPLWPELMVFEHAAPQLLEGGAFYREDDKEGQPLAETEHVLPKTQGLPPTLSNSSHAAKLGDRKAQLALEEEQPTEGELHAKKLEAQLQRRMLAAV